MARRSVCATGEIMIMARLIRRGCVLLALGLAVTATFAATGASRYDVLIAGGTVYDGSGGPPFVGDVAIQDDRIAYVGAHAPHPARARGRARQGRRARLHQHAGAPGGVTSHRRPRTQRPAPGGNARGARRGFDGPAHTADEGARSAAPGRYPLPDRLDNAR